MSENGEAQGERSPKHGMFAGCRCRRLDLRFKISADKFDATRFLSFIKAIRAEPGNATEAVCRTLDPDSLDYHLHFTWDLRPEGVVLYMGFFNGTLPPEKGEREPFAENFMPWLGGFVANETAHSDIHAEFRYPLSQRGSKLLLPIKVKLLPDEDTEITGMLLRFAPQSNGISTARVELGEKRISVEMSGATRVEFKSFDLGAAVGQLSDFALLLTEEKKTV